MFVLRLSILEYILNLYKTINSSFNKIGAAFQFVGFEGIWIDRISQSSFDKKHVINSSQRTATSACKKNYQERWLRSFNGLQGCPAQTIQAGISFVTTDLAPTTQPFPIITPG